MTGHEFKPYADMPDMCVAELDSGDTCNRPREDHGDRRIYSRYRVERLRAHEPYPYCYSAASEDDRFDYGSVATFSEAMWIADRLARQGIADDD